MGGGRRIDHTCAKAFVDAVGKGGESAIALGELPEVVRVSIEIETALR